VSAETFTPSWGIAGTQPDDPTDAEAGRGLQAGDEPGEARPVAVDEHVVAVPEPRRRLLDVEGARDLPEWATSREALSRELDRLSKAAAVYARWMALQSPRALAVGAWWAIRGTVTLWWRLTRWATDVDGHPLVGKITAGSDKAYHQMAEARAKRQKFRASVLGGGALLLAGVAAGMWAAAPRWVLVLAVLAVILGLARVGQPPDRRLISPVVSRPQVPRLTSQSIAAALGGLGIAALSQVVNKGRTAQLFPDPITRVKTGWLAAVDLPLGVTAAEVAERRAKLASGLRRPVGAVWPEGDSDTHEGRLRLYVLDQPMSKMPQPAWPLSKAGKADIFKALPYGFDQRGDLVKMPLMYSNLLVGAIPRQGKSFSVRVVVLGAALDPSVEMHVHELKGTGDFEAVEPSCHRYTSGPADPETLTAVMGSIREVYGYLAPRANAIKALGPARCPEKKVTRAIADDRTLVLWPVLLVVDEVQELFDSEYAAEAEQMLRAIIKRGPALGIMLVLSSQRPDAKSLPTSISSNMGHRLCLRVADQMANDMILGTSAYRVGMNATLFSDSDLGIGLLRTGGVKAVTVRSSYLDAAAADRIGKRAHAIRTAAGTLTGSAVGDDLTGPEDRLAVVVDAVESWSAAGGDDSAWLHVLEDALAEAHPGRYQGLEAPWLGARLRAAGVATLGQRTRMVSGEQVNRAGVDLAALRAALEAEATPTG
jgi:S-DNA-T family DNA segregation ATPase FtsK/SpoIIIE